MKSNKRIMWGLFRASVYGVIIAILLVPASGKNLGISNKEEDRSFLSAMIANSPFQTKVKVIMNDKVIAIARSKEEATKVYYDTRLAYNSKGIQILPIRMEFVEVDKDKDQKLLKSKKVLKGEQLEKAYVKAFDKVKDDSRELAYTLRVDDCQVTMNSIYDVVEVLEKAQNVYDTTDRFAVSLTKPSSNNIAMYEVAVKENKGGKKTDDEKEKTEDRKETSQEVGKENGEENAEESASKEQKEDNKEAGQESASQDGDQEDGQSSNQEEADSQEELSDSQDGESLNESDNENSGEASEEESQQETKETIEDNSLVKEQGKDDGVKNVGFAQTILVTTTFASKDSVTKQKKAYKELTSEKGEEAIYVVQSGDYLDLIAEKNGMTVDEIKELNPQITSDEDLYYDDRLNVMKPEAPLSITVEKQETYEEEYYADVVYEEDDSMYTDQSVVVQDGEPGSHVVTDLVTYIGGAETNRQEVLETIQVDAVAEIVRRGTMSRPTYMYPVSNWNVTSTFGTRWGRLHAGTDVGIPIGTTVRASRGGQIITAGWVGGYGNCVMIDHGDGITTVYGHLSQVCVSVGQYVNQGDTIALSGNTGRSTGPHLHFEVRVNGSATDATPYLEGTN